MIYYHNPKCSKSREGLALLEKKGVSLQIKEYLKEGLTQKEIKDLFKKLNLPLIEGTRTKEKIFKELNLQGISEAELLKAIAENPTLLERPILATSDKAIIGRPPENLLVLIK